MPRRRPRSVEGARKEAPVDAYEVEAEGDLTVDTTASLSGYPPAVQPDCRTPQSVRDFYEGLFCAWRERACSGPSFPTSLYALFASWELT